MSTYALQHVFSVGYELSFVIDQTLQVGDFTILCGDLFAKHLHLHCQRFFVGLKATVSFIGIRALNFYRKENMQ